MDALLGIIWFVILLISMALVFSFVGMSSMTNFFPEGKRWYHFPIQLASLAFFAAVVLMHPF